MRKKSILMAALMIAAASLMSCTDFDTEELQRLQEIALQISERKSQLVIKHSIMYRILSFLKLK